MCYNDRRREEASYAALADVVIAPVWRTEERGSIPRGSTKQCPGGEMADAPDLGSGAERCGSSSLPRGTIHI